MRRFLLWVLGIVVVIAAIVFAGVAILGTDTRPAPPVVAGYTETTLTVSHRTMPLPVHIWYPATQGGTPELIGQNALFYGTYILRDATPLPGPTPVVLLSHGSGGNAVNLGWIATELALRGMIVIATDHPGTTSRDSDPAQTVKIWERPADLTALLDFIAATPPAGLTSDMSRVGVLGFSLGGQSALAVSGIRESKDAFIAYCDANAGKIDCGWMQAAGVDFTAIDQNLYEQSNRDPRVRATVAVDPALTRAIPAGGAADLTNRTLIINLGAPGNVPEAMRADDLAAAAPDATFASILDVWHFTFLAECSTLGRIAIWTSGEDAICSDPGSKTRGAAHQELIDLIGGFLQRNLVGPS